MFFKESIPFQARLYISAVVFGALPIFLYCLSHSIHRTDLDWLYLAGLTGVATCFPVRIAVFKDKMWITLSDVFVFSAMLHFGPQVAVVIAVIEGLTFNVRIKVTRLHRQLFNLAQIALVAFVISHVLILVLGRTTDPQDSQLRSAFVLVGMTLVCGLLYFLLTSGFVAGAMALSSRESFVPIWKRSLAWASLTLTGAALASVIFLYLN